MGYTLKKIETEYGYKIIHTDVQFGAFEYKKSKSITLLFDMEVGMVPGHEYDVYPGVEGLEVSHIILYEFTTILRFLINNGTKKHNNETRYAIPIVKFERIK